MSRICPKCKAKLGGYDNFFCTACGESLPTELVSRDGVFSRVANFAANSKDAPASSSTFPNLLKNLRLFINMKNIALTALFLFIVVGGAYTIKMLVGKEMLKSQEPVAVNESTSSVSYSKNVVESPLNWEFNTFDVGGILAFVPFDADIVIEGNDLTKFITAYVQIDPSYKELASFLNGKTEQQFIFFARDINGVYNWSLVYFPLSADFKMSGDLTTKYSALKFWKSDSVALITPDDSIVAEVADAKGKTAKNFTQTPFYATTKSTTPKNGKALIYLASPKAKEYFKELQKLPNLSKDLQMVVESISKENPDYSVIL